jgi:hypothetical protein
MLLNLERLYATEFRTFIILSNEDTFYQLSSHRASHVPEQLKLHSFLQVCCKATGPINLLSAASCLEQCYHQDNRAH